MTSTSVSVDFNQRCPDCGGVFSIDQFEPTERGFRVRLAIENTGEHGTLHLVMDGCRLFAMQEEQAAWWARSYTWKRAQGRAAWELYDKVESSYSLRPLDEEALPQELLLGESWSGWFESSRSLDENVVALVGFLGPFKRERPASFLSHMTMDRTRPFISLRGEVTVKPAPFLKRWAGWALAVGRCFWRLEYLGILVGGVVGSAADVLLDTQPLLRLVGIPSGWYLFHLLSRRLRDRRR